MSMFFTEAADRWDENETTIPLLDEEEASLLLDGDPDISPAQYSRFVYNITPWTYRVSRRVFQHLVVSKARQRRAERERRGGRLSSSDAAPRRVCCPTVPGARSPLGLPVLPPTHPFIAAWSVLMLGLDLVYTAVVLPLALAFRLNANPGWALLSLSVGFLFTADLVVLLHRGVAARYMGKVLYVDAPGDVARLVAWHGDLWVALPVALSAPLQLAAHFLEGPAAAAAGADSWRLGLIQVFVLVRGLRLVRLLMLQRHLFFERPAVRHTRREVALFFASLAYVLWVLLTWLACMMLAIAHYESPAEATWLASVKGKDLTQAPPLRQYIAAVYFVTVTACTVGYGDASGGTALEQVACVFTIVVGVTFIAFSAKSMVDALLEAALQDESAQRVALLRDRGRALSTWSRWQSTGREVLEAVLAFFEGPGLDHQVTASTWGRLMADLPASLRGEVLWAVLFRHHPEARPLGLRLLEGVAPRDAVHALAQLEVAPLCSGHALCWEGERADAVWLLQEGELVALDGVLPRGGRIRGPALVLPFDLPAWLDHQREQRLAGAPPHAHTHPLHASRSMALRRNGGGGGGAKADGGGGVGVGGGGGEGEFVSDTLPLPLPPPPCYAHSLQAATNCFLYRLPLSRLALIVRCLPAVGDNLLRQYSSASE